MLKEDEAGRPPEPDAASMAAPSSWRSTRQPIHTVYIPADRFAASSVADWGAVGS